ncbi:MAG TPA: alpha-galactosidase [Phycisphaerae bacterium]|nr:alpha-galactosidase [Phycisphaerae bacterium]
MTREFFRSGDGAMLGIRVSVTNVGARDVRLASLTPLAAEGETAVRVAGAGPADWRVLRMSRHKNDVPGAFHPTVKDIDFEHARVDGAEFRAGMGSTTAERPDLRCDDSIVQSEPCLCIRNERAPDARVLRIAVLGQTEHLSRLILALNSDRVGLHELCAQCEFDGVLLSPGKSRRTHWLLLREGADERELLEDFTEMIAAEMNVPVPAPAPTVFCSWYFYGRDFHESDLLENLDELKRRPIPFDVFLIDNCWMDNFGEWNANARFPSGMAKAAEAIRAGGFVPGIWTCPFVLSPHSAIVRKYPRLVLRDADGQPCTFPYREADTSDNLYVLDPTAPEAKDYLLELFGRLRAWGFRAHKLDFLRALIVPRNPRFCNERMNRAQAYRLGMEHIRAGAGDDYILACGGLFEGSAGLVDGNRIGSDVKGRWIDPDGRIVHPIRIKQNAFRSHTNRLWHTDPDALQIRRRKGPFRGQTDFAHLSDGSFTDDEVYTCLVNQYIGGGLVCLSERMAELAEDRRRMLRHVIPPVTPPARPLDLCRPFCPTLFLTSVTPRDKRLGGWWTLAVLNWENEPVTRDIPLRHIPAAGKLAVFELVTQAWLGVHEPTGVLRIGIPAHGSRMLRVAPWDGRSALLLGTDCHMSGGAAEFRELEIRPDCVRGELDSRWNEPVALTVGVPNGGGLTPASLTVARNGRFSIGLEVAPIVAAIEKGQA